jgi:hypothetical protein
LIRTPSFLNATLEIVVHSYVFAGCANFCREESMTKLQFKVRLLIVSIVGIAALLTPASAASPLTYYPSRASFNAAQPSLPIQVFQPLYYPAVIASPLSSSENNSVFAPGSILPGLAISIDNKSLSPTGLYVDASSVACNWFGYPLILSFSPAITAFGADLFASSGGQSWAGTFTAVMYNGKTAIGEHRFSEAAYQNTFLGFTSTIPVTAILVTFRPSTDVDWAPHVENIAFGISR